MVRGKARNDMRGEKGLRRGGRATEGERQRKESGEEREERVGRGEGQWKGEEKQTGERGDC